MMFWHTFFVIGNPDAEQRTRYTRYKRPCRLPPRACNDFFPGISLKGESVNRIRAIRAPWQRQKQLLWVSGCGPSRNEPLGIHDPRCPKFDCIVCICLFYAVLCSFLPSSTLLKHSILGSRFRLTQGNANWTCTEIANLCAEEIQNNSLLCISMSQKSTSIFDSIWDTWVQLAMGRVVWTRNDKENDAM